MGLFWPVSFLLIFCPKNAAKNRSPADGWFNRNEKSGNGSRKVRIDADGKNVQTMRAAQKGTKPSRIERRNQDFGTRRVSVCPSSVCKHWSGHHYGSDSNYPLPFNCEPGRFCGPLLADFSHAFAGGHCSALPLPSGCPSTWPVNAVMCLMSRRAGPVRNLGRSSRSLCVICTLAWAFSRHRFSCPPGEALRWSEGNFGCNLHMELFKSYCAKVPQSHLFLRLEFGSFAAGEAPVLMDTFINSLGWPGTQLALH